MNTPLNYLHILLVAALFTELVSTMGKLHMLLIHYVSVTK